MDYRPNSFNDIIIKEYSHVFKDVFTENLAVKDEQVLILGDYGSDNRELSPILTHAYTLAAKELGLNYKTVFQQAIKDKGEYASEEVIKVLGELPEKSVLVVNLSNGLGKIGELGKSFRKYCNSNNHRFVSANSLGGVENSDLSLFLNALNVDLESMKKETEILCDKLTEAKEVRVKTEAGTDLTYNVEDVTAKTNIGIYREPGTGGNLPGGEAYTPPLGKKVDGKVVIDGSSNIRTETQSINTPITLTIKNGSIVNIEGGIEAERLRGTIEWAQSISKKPENCLRIGELGIGTNPNAKLLGATIIDEKVKGTAHIAIGSNYWFGGDIKSIIHMDQVFKDPDIYLDGEKIK